MDSTKVQYKRCTSYPWKESVIIIVGVSYIRPVSFRGRC